MMGEIYVMRLGRLVPKRTAEPLVRTSAAPSVISDYLPDLRHPSSGKRYDSKSGFRAETRARGLTEVGNETLKDTRRLDIGSAQEDIRRAISELGG